MQQSLLRILIVVLLGICTAILLAPLISQPFRSTEYFFKSNPSNEVKQAQTSSITFVGDVMLSREVSLIREQFGDQYPFLGYKIASSGNSIVGNFEAAISADAEDGVLSKDLRFVLGKDIIETVKKAGFTHLSLANNHSLDAGSSALEESYLLFGESGIDAFGNPVAVNQNSVTYIDIDDIRVALVALHTLFTPPSFKELDNLFIEVNKNSDWQIAFMHWGEEYELKHSPKQEQLANTLVQLGADTVIGHHPHVVQDIQLVNNVPVFYSLGNYIFDQYFSDDVQQGLVLKLSLKDGSFEIDLEPVSTLGSVMKPRSMSGREREVFLNKLAEKSDETLRSQIIEGKIVLPFTLASF